MNNQTGNNTNKEERPPRRITFLLRLWCEGQTGGSNWRASLELPGDGKRIGFASLEEMFIYLIDYSEGCNNVQETENKE